MSRVVSLVLVLLLLLPVTAALGTPGDASPGESGIVARLEEQNARLAAELRQIKREIAALRADLEKPGLQEIFGGLGYILGLFGVAAFVAARRRG